MVYDSSASWVWWLECSCKDGHGFRLEPFHSYLLLFNIYLLSPFADLKPSSLQRKRERYIYMFNKLALIVWQSFLKPFLNCICLLLKTNKQNNDFFFSEKLK